MTAAALTGAVALLSPAAAQAESKVTLVPASGSAGTRASVTGSDFGKRDRVIVRAGGRVTSVTRTTARGSFRATFTVPRSGFRRLRVVSRSGGRRIANIFHESTVSDVGEIVSRRGRRLRWTPARGAAGSAVNLEGSGFPAGRLVRARFGAQKVATPRVDRDGEFSALVTVPSLAAGRRFVRVKAGRAALGFFFRVLRRPAADDGVAGGTPRDGGDVLPPPAAASGDPVIAAAGDIACSPESSSFRKGLGTSSRCRQKHTSDLLVNGRFSAVLPLGDIQYECGTLSEFTRSYDLSWGRVKPITRPVPGNHEYGTPSGCTPGRASGYFGYFGAAAGDPARGYYSYDLGAWHVVALNSNCSIVSCSSSSAQVRWLRQDLAAHPALCTLAYWHHPRFTSGSNAPGSSSVKPLYQALYDHGAEVVLAGHDHHYERFAPQDANGARNVARGLREFVVGTGGRNFHSLNSPRPNSEVRNNSTFGILRLTLRPASYEWQFVPEAGKTFRDAGAQACH